MKRVLVGLVLCAVVGLSGMLYGATLDMPRGDTWTTNGTVYAAAVSGGLVYIGGSFNNVSMNIGDWAPISATTGKPVFFPKVNNRVRAAVPDGSGGWYIGGEFTKVGTVTRNRAAHILSDGSVDPVWDPNFNEAVWCFAVHGSTIYAGGNFTTLAGGTTTRNRLAALDATTGLASGWDTNGTNSTVRAVAVSSGIVYAGGDFNLLVVGGATRNHIAAFDATSGLVTGWDPDVNNRVNVFAVVGSTVYVGGEFTQVGVTARNYIAAIDTTTGLVTDWDPNSQQRIQALTVYGSTVYVGGIFTSIGGQARTNIAALDATTGLATGWASAMTGAQLYAIIRNGDTVYAGGQFTVLGGQPRSNVAALDATTGFATAWDPGVNDVVSTIAVDGNTVSVGGVFTTIGTAVTRNNLAAIDTATGMVTSWDPNASGAVRALAVNGNTVYVGGSFTTFAGATTRRYIAALDATTGLATAWDPDADDMVAALAINGNTVYAGGTFNAFAGGLTTRNHLAAIDATTGLATAWDPNAGDSVWALGVTGDKVYVGGDFTTFAGATTRNRLAAIDRTTGLATAWDPNAGGTVRALSVNGNTVYAGGDFTTLGGAGTTRQYIAAIDTTTGLATAWDPKASGTVRALAVSGNTVYAAGEFTTFAGATTRNRLAAIDATTGLATSWNPNVSGTVFSLALDVNTVYAGGWFSTIGEGIYSCFAGFGFVPDLSASGITPASGPLAGGTAVTITGTAFASGATVSIGGRAATGVSFVNSTRLTAVTPAGASAGAKDVVITNPDTHSATLTGAFTYTANPTDGDTVVNSTTTPVDVSAGGTAAISPVSGAVTVTVPGGTFGSAVTLTVSTAVVPSSHQSTVQLTNLAIEITNSAGLQPDKAITITMYYRDSDITGCDESKLTIARYDNGRWIPIPTVVYADQNKVVGTVQHLSVFAILMPVAATDLNGVKAYPNPFSPKTGSLILTGLTAAADIKIYTVAGELVRTLPYTSADGRAFWDGKNDGGSPVASGVYLAFIKSPQGKKTIKIAVER